MKAVFNNIIVKPIEAEETQHGNIIVPNMAKEVGLRGIIVSIGPGMYSVTGEYFVKTTLKEGDKVILPPIGPVKIQIEGEDYWSCSETQVIAVI